MTTPIEKSTEAKRRVDKLLVEALAYVEALRGNMLFAGWLRLVEGTGIHPGTLDEMRRLSRKIDQAIGEE